MFQEIEINGQYRVHNSVERAVYNETPAWPIKNGTIHSRFEEKTLQLMMRKQNELDVLGFS